MTKWYALAFILAGVALYAPAKPPWGEAGMPFYAFLGVCFFVVGVVMMGVLIFMRL